MWQSYNKIFYWILHNKSCLHQKNNNRLAYSARRSLEFCPGLVAHTAERWLEQGEVLTAYHIYSETEAASAMPICLCKCLHIQTADGRIVRTCPLAMLQKTQSQRRGNTAIGTGAKEVQLLQREKQCSSCGICNFFKGSST